ncbi:MAG: hypothetical protein ABSC05_19880 [Candidatus Solibacter sp.]|jgi:hypothetical protein
MVLDLSRLDQEISRLQALKTLLSDPRSAELAREILIGTDGGAVPKPNSSSPAPTGQRTIPFSSDSKVDAVRRALTPMEGEFKVGGVADLARKSMADLTNGDVSRSLKQMAKTGELEIVNSSRGSKGNTFKKGAKFRQVN